MTARHHPNLHLERRDNVAVIRFDNPPVNALNNGIRAALDALIDRLLADPAVAGIMFAGAGGGFVAGADIRELQAGVQPPFLGDMLRRVELSPKRSGAAIRGHAMGGGLEIALACGVRVASADARMALPELKLGLIPAAGGTQRLPRLVGTAQALDLMLTSRIVDAREARAIGLIDAIAEDDDVESACIAAMMAGTHRPHYRHAPAAVEAARARVAADPKLSALPAASAAVDSVANLASGNADRGYIAERSLFMTCLNSAEAIGRIRAFAERSDAAKRAKDG